MCRIVTCVYFEKFLDTTFSLVLELILYNTEKFIENKKILDLDLVLDLINAKL